MRAKIVRAVLPAVLPSRLGRFPSLGVVLLSAVFALGIQMPAGAVYNANMSGVVTFVATYMEGDAIYIRLNNQPSSHPGCDPTYFVIPADIAQNRRNQALAR